MRYKEHDKNLDVKLLSATSPFISNRINRCSGWFEAANVNYRDGSQRRLGSSVPETNSLHVRYMDLIPDYRYPKFTRISPKSDLFVCSPW